ncbi:hypothetical protein [Microbacterium amylolyticum]|uniref:Uncharacterized protein n=1 Tax=Microbacterium amylolyticum TaxID=936337 RepID=A0ABS4ZI30_9MICO|nr:hypothetical protein [Microbacterium amylolyticum]MBP2436927.1 hypothetical protein [Microbacterium amylolyticum]
MRNEELSVPPELEGDDDIRQSYVYRRNRRVRGVAWIVIAALILAGGGSTVLLTLFG